MVPSPAQPGGHGRIVRADVMEAGGDGMWFSVLADPCPREGKSAGPREPASFAGWPELR